MVSGFGFRVSGFGFRVSGVGFRVSGVGLQVSGMEGPEPKPGTRTPLREERERDLQEVTGVAQLCLTRVDQLFSS